VTTIDLQGHRGRGAAVLFQDVVASSLERRRDFLLTELAAGIAWMQQLLPGEDFPSVVLGPFYRSLPR